MAKRVDGAGLSESPITGRRGCLAADLAGQRVRECPCNGVQCGDVRRLGADDQLLNRSGDAPRAGQPQGFAERRAVACLLGRSGLAFDGSRSDVEIAAAFVAGLPSVGGEVEAGALERAIIDLGGDAAEGGDVFLR